MKEISRSDYRVVVYPFEPTLDQSHDRWVRDLEAIQEQIERHVDGLAKSNIQTEITWTTRYACDSCSSEIELAAELTCHLCGESLCVNCNRSSHESLKKAECVDCWDKETYESVG